MNIGKDEALKDDKIVSQNVGVFILIITVSKVQHPDSLLKGDDSLIIQSNSENSFHTFLCSNPFSL